MKDNTIYNRPDNKVFVKTSGDLPRIELFARNVGLFKDGWDYWGDQV